MTDATERARKVLADIYREQGWSRPPAFMALDNVVAAMLTFAAAEARLSDGRVEVLLEALEKIASCRIIYPGDVVDIARAALASTPDQAEAAEVATEIGCEYCRNDGPLTPMRTCPGCDAEYPETAEVATPAGEGAQIPAGMKPWAGSDAAPADWDGGPVLLADGELYDHAADEDAEPLNWEQYGQEGGCLSPGCIVAYAPIDRPAIRAVSERLLSHMREVARQNGWAIAVHGSMSRDLDLIAVPWTDQATDEPAFLEAIRAAVAQELAGKCFNADREPNSTALRPFVKPHGRRSYTLHALSDQLAHGAAGALPYIDLCIVGVTPTAPQAAAGDGLVEAHPDDLAVDLFAAQMKAKLARARMRGRGGWDDPKQCSPDYLRQLLHEHVTKGDPVDVANFCMMLAHYGAPTTMSSPSSVVRTRVKCDRAGCDWSDGRAALARTERGGCRWTAVSEGVSSKTATPHSDGPAGSHDGDEA